MTPNSVGREFFHQQHVDLARVGAQHFEAQVLEVEHLALVRHAAQVARDEAADGVDIVLGQVDADLFVELLDLRQLAHRPQAESSLPFDEVPARQFLVLRADRIGHVRDGDIESAEPRRIDVHAHLRAAAAPHKGLADAVCIFEDRTALRLLCPTRKRAVAQIARESNATANHNLVMRSFTTQPFAGRGRDTGQFHGEFGRSLSSCLI